MAPVAGGGVALGIFARGGGHGGGVAAAGGMLLADVDVGGEGAFVEDQGFAADAGAGA